MDKIFLDNFNNKLGDEMNDLKKFINQKYKLEYQMLNLIKKYHNEFKNCNIITTTSQMDNCLEIVNTIIFDENDNVYKLNIIFNNLEYKKLLKQEDIELHKKIKEEYDKINEEIFKLKKFIINKYESDIFLGLKKLYSQYLKDKKINNDNNY